MHIVYKNIYNIIAKPGNGGNGSKSSVYSKGRFFPDGGNGGNGGSVIFRKSNCIFPNIRSSHLYEASNGMHGKRSNKDGKYGDDVIVYLSQNCYLKINNNTSYSHVFDYTIDDVNNELIIQGGKGGIGSRIDHKMRRRQGEIMDKCYIQVKNFLRGTCVILNYDYSSCVRILHENFGTTKFSNFLYVRSVHNQHYYITFYTNKYIISKFQLDHFKKIYLCGNECLNFLDTSSPILYCSDYKNLFKQINLK